MNLKRPRLLQIDVEVEEPETSENPTKSFVIHYIVWTRTQLLAVIICIIWYRYLCIIWYYLDIELQDCNARVVHFLVIWITVLLLVLWHITRRTLVSGISTTRLVVISAMVEKELGERNFGLTRWSTWTATCRRLPRGTIARQRAAGSRQRAVQSTSGWCESGRTRDVAEPVKVVCDS